MPGDPRRCPGARAVAAATPVPSKEIQGVGSPRSLLMLSQSLGSLRQPLLWFIVKSPGGGVPEGLAAWFLLCVARAGWTIQGLHSHAWHLGAPARSQLLPPWQGGLPRAGPEAVLRGVQRPGAAPSRESRHGRVSRLGLESQTASLRLPATGPARGQGRGPVPPGDHLQLPLPGSLVGQFRPREPQTKLSLPSACSQAQATHPTPPKSL